MASLVNEPLTVTNSALSSTLEGLPSSSSSPSIHSSKSNLDASAPVVAASGGDSASQVDSSSALSSDTVVPVPESDSADSMDTSQQDLTTAGPTPASALAHSSPLVISDSTAASSMGKSQQQQSTLVVPIMAGAGVLLLLILLILLLAFRLRRLRQRRIQRIMHSLNVDFGYIEIVGGLRGKQREGAMGKLMGKNHSIDAGWPASSGGRPRTGNWDLALAMAQEFVLAEQQLQSTQGWYPDEPGQQLESLPPRLPAPLSIPGIRISECSTLAPSECSVAI